MKQDQVLPGSVVDGEHPLDIPPELADRLEPMTAPHTMEDRYWQTVIDSRARGKTDDIDPSEPDERAWARVRVILDVSVHEDVIVAVAECADGWPYIFHLSRTTDEIERSIYLAAWAAPFTGAR